MLPAFMNNTKGRKKVKELTGEYTVPVLVTDTGEVVKESSAIVAWAERNPAASRAR
jgi:glutathione S-transferase